MRTPEQDPSRGRTGSAMVADPVTDLGPYRDAVTGLLDEVSMATGPGRRKRVAAIIVARAADPELRGVLRATPDGVDQTVETLLREVRDYRPNPRSSAVDLAAMIRIYLLSRIDVMWWGHVPPYRTDADLLAATDLVDLEPLRRRDRLNFRYLRQPDGLFGRAGRAARRRITPERVPRTAGLRFTQTRPAAVALLNRLAVDFAARSPEPGRPLWVTSLARSLQHQARLRALGYAAMLPSSHCVGYGMDIEMSWYRRHGGDAVLATLLRERQAAGEINVIDEGQAWHVCLSPTAPVPMRRALVAAPGR